MKHHGDGKGSRAGSHAIQIKPLAPGAGVADLIDNYYNAYNAARIREICHLMAGHVMKKDVTVGVSLAGALTPAGFGSLLIPLMEKGFIDYIVATGANLYHDLQYGLGFQFRRGSPFADDVELFKKRLIRIYDIIIDFESLLHSDQYLYNLIDRKEYQRKMSTSELHHLIGRDVDRVESAMKRKGTTLLAAAFRCDVPIYTSSPGDSTIGMNVAARALDGAGLEFDVSLDVNETCAIVHEAKRKGKSAVVMLGGGSPKNFLLQTEPQLQEVLGLDVTGHDYYVQITDARPDTGGLSGATPGEAVSWGKVDPEMLPHAVVAYSDTTVAFPLVASYVLTKCKPRPLKRLFRQRERLVAELREIVAARRASGKRSTRGTILAGNPGHGPRARSPRPSKKPAR